MIIPMIIQTILLDPSGAVWSDGASNVSRPERFWCRLPSSKPL